jgi:hypothetical protein
MKIYTITVVLVGLMFMFNIFGIPTTSNKIIDSIGGTASSDITTSSLFGYVVVFLAAVGIITVAGIMIGQYAAQAAFTAAVATFIGSIYLLFSADLYSIVKLVGFYSGVTSWQYYITWALIVPLIAGMIIAVVEFVQGKD